jgi:hypothetical protein
MLTQDHRVGMSIHCKGAEYTEKLGTNNNVRKNRVDRDMVAEIGGIVVARGEIACSTVHEALVDRALAKVVALLDAEVEQHMAVAVPLPQIQRYPQSRRRWWPRLVQIWVIERLLLCTFRAHLDCNEAKGDTRETHACFEG